MSGTELQPSFREKLEIFKKQHFPMVERSEVIDAIYEVPNLGPMDFNTKGAPIFFKTYVIMILAGFVAGGWLVLNLLFAQGRLFLEPALLERINVVGIASTFIFMSCIMWIIISMNKGTFNDYKRVIDFLWFHLDRRPTKRGELRVKRIVQIWPRDKAADARTDELEKKMYKDLLIKEKQLLALAGMTPELEKRLTEAGIKNVADIATSEVSKLKKIKDINDDFASILIGQAKSLMETPSDEDVEDTETDTILTEMEKASSLYRMKRMLKSVEGLKAVPKARDIAAEGISLRNEFLRLARSINTNKVYSILECAGDLFILVISDYPLTGGDDDGTATNKQVEFKDHDCEYFLLNQICQFPSVHQTTSSLV